MRINEVVSDFLKTWRGDEKQHGKLTLDRIANESRRYGGMWTSSTISSMEKGISTGSLENMLILTKVIGAIDGKPFRLADLFSGEGDIELGDGVTISRKEIRKALNGEDYEMLSRKRISDDPAIQGLTAKITSAIPDVMQHLSERLFFMASRLDGGEVMSHQPTLAEERAAKKLGITPLAVASICLLSYNSFLDNLAAKRAGRYATPQKRGRETREILKELDLLLDYILETGNFPLSWDGDYDDCSERTKETSELIELIEQERTNPTASKDGEIRFASENCRVADDFIDALAAARPASERPRTPTKTRHLKRKRQENNQQ